MGSGLVGLYMKDGLGGGLPMWLMWLPSLGISQPWEGQPLQGRQCPRVEASGYRK